MKIDYTTHEKAIDRLLQPYDPYEPEGQLETLALEVEKLRMAVSILLAATEGGTEIAERVRMV